MQPQNAAGDRYTGVWGGVAFPEVFQWNVSPVHNFSNPVCEHDPFFIPHPPPPPCSFNRRPFGYDGGSSENHLRLVSESLGGFGLHAELQKMTAQEIMDAKAHAASKSHSEAERRRRERIKTHLDKLRSLLPNTTKTDKASLLAEVIQHVKELKRQTSQIAETSAFPTELDELCVENASDEEGKLVIKTSISCKDRADLFPDLINTLKSLKLKTLKAEITTLGGRVKNVLFITRDTNEDNEEQQEFSIASIKEAFKSIMEKCNGDESGSETVKRQRTNINIL